MTPPRFPHFASLLTRRSIFAMLAVLGAFLLATSAIAPASPLRLNLLRSQSGRHSVAGPARLPSRLPVTHRGGKTGRGSRHSRTRRHRRPVRLVRHEKIHVSQNEPVESSPRPAPQPETTSTSLPWHGDFETGDLSQWETWQEVAPDRITVTQNPVRQGSYAARFEVKPGDNIGDTPTRAELATDLHEQEGEERYYRWYTYFPESFPTNYPNSFITFTQWRAKDESDSYSSFMVWGNQIELRHDGTRWATTLTKGVWHKFVYHVKWSPDPNVGFNELWYDDELVVPKVRTSTRAGSPGAAVGNYVKQGLYKSDDIPTAVLYQDGFTAGTSFAEVNDAP
jgi:hypothetical protein